LNCAQTPSRANIASAAPPLLFLAGKFGTFANQLAYNQLHVWVLEFQTLQKAFHAIALNIVNDELVRRKITQRCTWVSTTASNIHGYSVANLSRTLLSMVKN
jgi:hypothetical protein